MDTLVAQQLSQTCGPSNGNSLARGSLLDFSDEDTLYVGATFTPDSSDQIDAILNKIDAELINMQSKQTTSVDSKYKRKPNKMERAMLSEQGVVFDTGDETNSEMKITLEDIARLAKSSSLDKPSDDTGLGSRSASVNDDEPMENALQSSALENLMATTQEFGADRSRRSSGCSSLAQHINIRFQKMMSDFDDSDSTRNFKQEDQTDLDSIRTEELELEFCKTLIAHDGPVASLKSIQRRLKPQMLPASGSSRQNRMSAASETDSIATENFGGRFQALLDSQNVGVAAIGTFPAHKSAGAGNSCGTESNFPDNGDGEDDEHQDAASLQNLLEKRYQELIQHSSSNGFLHRPDLSGEDELNSTSVQPTRTVNALEKRSDTPGKTWTQNRSKNVSSNTLPLGVTKTVSSVTSDQELSEDDRTLDDAGSSRSIRELQNQRSFHSQRKDIRTKPVKAFPPPNNFQLQNKIDLEVSLKLQDELKTLQSQIKQCLQARQDLLKEIPVHQDMASKYREEIKVIEHQVKDSRAKAEDARSSLMLMEFKRESLQRQLEHLAQEVDEKEHHIQELEKSGKKLQEIGFTTEEVTNIISEREELRERLKLLEASVGDHFSAEQNLNALKENIMAEKKKYRESINGLQRELELKQTTINELNTTQGELIHKLKQFEKRCQDVEQEKKDFIKSHSRKSSSAEMQMKAELSSTRDHAVSLQQRLDEALEQLQIVKLENARKDEHSCQLREQLEALKEELNKERDLQDSLVEDNVKSLKAVILEKEMALEAARADAEKKCMDNYEHEQDLKNNEKHYCDQLAAMQEQLTNRDLQLEALTDRLRQQETWVNQMSKRIHEDTYLKYHHLLEEERAKLESDKDAAISLKLRDLHEETERTVRQMNEDLNRERTQSQNYHKQIFALREELEETKYQCQQATREKAELIKKLEAVDQNKEHQLALMKQKVELEAQKVVDRLRDTVNHQEEELERLHKDLKERESKEQEQLSESEKYEQGVLDELNQEYHATLQLLKAGPARLTSRTTCYAWSPTKLNYRGSGTRSILTATLETMKAACDELRQEVVQLRAEVDKYEHTMTKIDRERREELEALKAKMQNEKLEALEVLKERLIHTRPYPTGFFDVVNTQKMKEQRKRQQDWEQKRSTTVKSSGPGLCGSPVRATRSGSVASEENARTVAQLHSKVKQLQMENMTLQRSTSLSCSVPNLSVTSNATVGQPDNVPNSPLDREKSLRVRELELSLQSAESKSKMAEERASRNEQLFNQKLREHSRVQETMTQQTKELMQLQRAYSQLQNRCPSPSKSVVNRSALKTVS